MFGYFAVINHFQYWHVLVCQTILVMQMMFSVIFRRVFYPLWTAVFTYTVQSCTHTYICTTNQYLCVRPSLWQIRGQEILASQTLLTKYLGVLCVLTLTKMFHFHIPWSKHLLFTFNALSNMYSIITNCSVAEVCNYSDLSIGTDSKIKRPRSQCSYQCVGCNWRTCSGT